MLVVLWKRQAPSCGTLYCWSTPLATLSNWAENYLFHPLRHLSRTNSGSVAERPTIADENSLGTKMQRMHKIVLVSYLVSTPISLPNRPPGFPALLHIMPLKQHDKNRQEIHEPYSFHVTTRASCKMVAVASHS